MLPCCFQFPKKAGAEKSTRFADAFGESAQLDLSISQFQRYEQPGPEFEGAVKHL